MATETTGPTLTEIEAARRGLAGVRRVTPVYGSENLVATHRAQGGVQGETFSAQAPFQGVPWRGPDARRYRSRSGRVGVSCERRQHGKVGGSRCGGRRPGFPRALFVPQDGADGQDRGCRKLRRQA